jgi:membrane protein required for colicin V production
MPISMPTTLDILLLVVMLISGLLAMIRGFMREILSIGAWGIAAIAALVLYANLGDTATNSVAAAIVFLVTLLLVSIITARISDLVLDSRVGALDRTLGFLFGLGRGLLLVVVAYVFFNWLVVERSQPEWVRSAKSVFVLQKTGDWLKGLLPEDLDKTISKYRKPKLEDQEPPDSTPDQKSELSPRTGTR